MAAALYSKLDAIATTLQEWKIEPPVNQVLDRLENYFDKVKHLANHQRPHFLNYVSFPSLIDMQLHIYEDQRRIGHTRPNKG